MYITLGTSVLHLLFSLVLTQFSLFYTAIIYVLIQGLITTLVYLQSQKIIKIQICNDERKI